jgi:hypothetical protein
MHGIELSLGTRIAHDDAETNDQIRNAWYDFGEIMLRRI